MPPPRPCIPRAAQGLVGTLFSEFQAFSLVSAALLRQMNVWCFAERLFALYHSLKVFDEFLSSTFLRGPSLVFLWTLSKTPSPTPGPPL